MPSDFWIRRISTRICSRKRASRFESGSSRSSTEGSTMSARARATRCCCPPERRPGGRFPSSARPTSARVSFTRRVISEGSTFRSFSP